MPYTDNRTILAGTDYGGRTPLEKADMALADLMQGGELKPQAAQKFLRLIIQGSPLLKMANAPPMASKKQEVARIGFGQRILRPGQPGVALTQAERSKPDFSNIELDTKLFKGQVNIPDEAFEDNIEHGALRQTLMETIGEAVSRDIEEVVVNGDTTSADPFLAQLDGILKQSQSNIVDAAGAPLSGALLTDVLKTIPSQYLREKTSMRFFTSVDTELGYRQTIAQRETEAGDRLLETDTPVRYSGVPIQPIPLFPENLGPQNNQTEVLLTNPRNITIGFWRRIKFATVQDEEAGQLKIIVTLRFDCRLADENGSAKIVQLAA